MFETYVLIVTIYAKNSCTHIYVLEAQIFLMATDLYIMYGHTNIHDILCQTFSRKSSEASEFHK